MANQETKYVDCSRSYIPIDPNSFPESMLVVDSKEEQRVPVIVYDGKNFLHTAYGYKSFFGLTEFDIDLLTERVDFIFVYQNDELNNFLIALCDSGIWYKVGNTTGAWTQSVVMPHYRDQPLIHMEWSFDTIEDKIYVYREGNVDFQVISSILAAPGILIESIVPTFLNMVAQKGIFRAGNRLGMWDSDDSIAWSSLEDPHEFTPDLETLAGSIKFKLLTGKIVNILSHGDGFIVYGTKSIVYARKSDSSLYLWDPTLVLSNGIAYRQEVVKGVPHTLHFAFTGMGLFKIENGDAEVIIPEITDFFKLSSSPKYLKLLEGRYLYFEMIDPEYKTGFPLYKEGEIPAITIPAGINTIAALYALTQTDPPTFSLLDFLGLLQQGVFITPPSEGDPGGGGGDPIEI